MSPVGEETRRDEGAQKWRGRETGWEGLGGVGITLHWESLGTRRPCQTRGPVEGRLVAMAEDGGCDFFFFLQSRVGGTGRCVRWGGVKCNRDR